jgi:tetratricopeptide (TPR) repeat protein
MKFLFFIIFGLVIYFLLDTIIVKTHYKKYRKFLAPAIFIFMLFIAVVAAANAALSPDVWWGKQHNVNHPPPAKVENSQGYFDAGNYEYDSGDCQGAVANYSKAISLDPNKAELYNNRGYTYMRLREYDKGLNDLDKAIEIRPNYVQALMNRGDIYNYYFEVDRQKAIEDYDKVLNLVKDSGQRRSLGVCGHRLIAQNNGWSPVIYLKVLRMGSTSTGCE